MVKAKAFMKHGVDVSGMGADYISSGIGHDICLSAAYEHVLWQKEGIDAAVRSE